MTVKVVFANAAYEKHMSNEGLQLEQGLAHHGWLLVGARHQIDMNDAREIINRLKPDIIFIQDPRDLFAENSGCFDKWTHIYNVDVLRNHPEIFKVVSFKDAATAIDYQRDFAARVGAHALATYYHERSVLAVSAWASQYRLLRHYHTVDTDDLNSFPFHTRRKPAIVSGHPSPDVYPLRNTVIRHAIALGVDVKKHFGWTNRGCDTPQYLRIISQYRVHIATCSKYRFALRKIIESVCCGCTTVTNLPKYDVLPVIDECLVRIPDKIDHLGEFRDMIHDLADTWDADRAWYWAQKAREYYDYRADARRLNDLILEAATNPPDSSAPLQTTR